MNYQAGPKAVVKVEYERDVVPSPLRGGYYVSQSATSTEESGDAVFAGVDFIF